MLSRRFGFVPVIRSSLQGGEGPYRSATRAVLLSDSALLLEAPGSGNTPRAEIRTVTDVLVSENPANCLVRSHRHPHPHAAPRRIAWSTRAKPRSPFRRGHAHSYHLIPASAAAQSVISRIQGADFYAGGRDPSRGFGRSGSAPAFDRRRDPQGARAVSEARSRESRSRYTAAIGSRSVHGPMTPAPNRAVRR